MTLMRAVQMAIYEERAARSMRGGGPALITEDFKPGVKIDAFVKPDRKDDSGWRGPCTVLDEVDGTVDYKWQSVVRRTDITKCRLAEYFVGFFHNFYESTSIDQEMAMSSTLLFLMDFTERMEFGSSQIHGTTIDQDIEVLTQAAEDNQLEIMKAAKEFALDWLGLAFCAGVALWHGRRKTPAVSKAPVVRGERQQSDGRE